MPPKAVISNPFCRLPPATALLVLTSIATAMPRDLPRQTPTVTLPYRTLAVVPFPLPTSHPQANNQLEIRQSLYNTVCGWIGGDPDVPATCGAGSHCVLDDVHSAVGCCPDGAACTTGVFTGCVDFNSGPQSVADPYVFTCGGGNVCYRNIFAGGYSQFGCGSASDLGTSVATSVSGSTLPLTQVSIDLTASPTSLATPTTLSSPTALSTSSSSTSSASSSSSTSSSTSSPTSSSSSSTSKSSSTETGSSTTSSAAAAAATQAPASGSSNDKTGAIIGGTLSGIAILVFLIAMGIYFCRRNRGNTRSGPGVNADTKYISPVSGPFAPLPPTDPHLHGTTTEIRASGPPIISPPQGFELGQYPEHAHFAAGGAMPPGTYSDTAPLNSNDNHIDDYRYQYQDALSRIGEEEEDELSQQGSAANPAGPPRFGSRNVPSRSPSPISDANVGGYGDPGASTMDSQDSNDRPLWQQGRRQSRNLMWM